MNIDIQFDARELQAAFDRAPGVVNRNINDWVKRSALRAERQAKIEVSDHVDTGQLQTSIHTFQGYQQAEVRPTAKHAIFVHEGRRPGSKMPPFGERSSLGRWAKKRGIEPFIVARSIARKGIKKDTFMTDAYVKIKPYVENDSVKMLDGIVRDI